jgi:Lhr-like helicase
MSKNNEHKDPKKNTFSAPEGYFDQFASRLMHQIEENELKESAPILHSIPKKDVYTAPDGYFENFRLEKSLVREIGTVRRLMYYAAAAAAIFILGYTLLPASETSSGKAEITLADVSDEELNSYVGEELPLEMNEDDVHEIIAMDGSSSFSIAAENEELENYILDEMDLSDVMDEL